MSIEEKIKLDTSDFDVALKKSKQLEKSFDDSQSNQTKATKKGISQRRQALRDSLANEIRNIRAMTANRIAQLNQAHKQEIISERQHAARLAAIRRSANDQVKLKKAERGFDVPTGGGIGVGASIATSAAFAGALRIGSQALDTYRELELAVKGLEGTARAFNQDARQATEAAKSLAADGLVTIERASQTMKFLISTGFSVSDSLEIAQGIKDTAAFNNVIGDMGQAMVDSAKGMKTGSIELIENAGLTVRLGAEMQKLGFNTADLTDETKKLEAAEALKGIVLKDTAKFAGDSARALDTYSGAKAQAASATRELMAAIGQSLATTFTPFLKMLADGARWVLEFWRGLSPASQQIIIWATALTGAGSALFSLIKMIGPAIAAMKALGVASLFSLGPLGLIVAGIAAVTAATVGFIELTKKSPGELMIQELQQLEQLEKQYGLTAEQQSRYNKLKDDMNAKYGEYLENLRLEGDNLERNRLIREQTLRQIDEYENDNRERDRIQGLINDTDRYNAEIQRLNAEIVRLENSGWGTSGHANRLRTEMNYLTSSYGEMIAAQQEAQQASSPTAPTRRSAGGGSNRGSRLADLQAQRDDFTTTEGALERERSYVEGRLQIVGDGIEREALLKREAELAKELSFFEHNGRLTEIETQEADARFELERLKIMGVRGAELSAAQDRANTLKKELKYEQAIKNEEVKAAKEAEEKKIAFKQKAGAEMLELGKALLSAEKGAFYAYLADRLRALSQALAKEMFTRAAASAASLDFIGAALYTAAGGIALAAGEAGARELDAEAERRRSAGQAQMANVGLDDIADFEPKEITDPGATTIINNYNNETNVSITETGTYVSEAQFVRNRLKPLLSELAIEQGAVLYK